MKKTLKIAICLWCVLFWLIMFNKVLAANDINKYKSIQINKVELINKLNKQIIHENNLKLEKENDQLVELLRIENEKITRQRISDKIKADRIIELEKIKKLNIEKSKNDNYYVTATFYTSDCYKCSGITAYGIDVRNSIYYKGYRIIAVDTSYIPLGSIVKVHLANDNFIAIAADTGGKIKGSRIDVLVSSSKEAFNLGIIKNVKISIIKKGG